MTNIKTYAAGIIAGLAIAGGALIGAGIAAASTDAAGPNQGPDVELHAGTPGQSAHFTSPQLSPRHDDAVRNYSQGGPAPTHTRHHHHAH